MRAEAARTGRLAALNPTALAADADARARAYLARLWGAQANRPLSPPGGDVEDVGALLAAGARVVTILAQYAKTGELPKGQSTIEPCVEALGWAVVGAQQGKVSPEAVRAVLAGKSPTTDDLHFAIGCAAVRGLIARGQPVNTSELAALADVSPSFVRQEKLGGKLEVELATEPLRHVVTAAEARRWLASRGVPGFTP